MSAGLTLDQLAEQTAANIRDCFYCGTAPSESDYDATDDVLLRIIREALEAAIQAQRENERLAFETLSKALTGGNASTWDELFHAAEHAQAQREQLAVARDEIERLKCLAQVAEESAKGAAQRILELHQQLAQVTQERNKLQRQLDAVPDHRDMRG